MDIGIKLGEYEVINSGSVITIENIPVMFSILDLKISFNFKTIECEGNAMSINVIPVSNKEVVYEFINYDSQLGCGLVEPVHAGTINNRELSFMIRCSKLNRGGKLLNYTWLLRDIPVPSDMKEGNKPEIVADK